MTDTLKQLTAAAKGGKVYSYVCDLASFSDIRQFADAVKAKHAGVNVLINNAGVFENNKSLSKDGFEMTWAINVLAPFLLTCLLLDTVTERIVNVSSISAGRSIDFDNLQQVMQFLHISACLGSCMLDLVCKHKSSGSM